MLRRALRENRRSAAVFVRWAVGSAMVLSLSYGIGYLPHLGVRAIPGWIFVTIAYGLVMASGLVLANGALWAAVVLIRERWRPKATPGLLARALACAAGGDLGLVGGEYAKSLVTRTPPDLTPLGPSLVGGAWLGLIFFFLRLAVDYARRYRRVKRATLLAQGQVLATQLEPHFLFNSLNSLSELIETDAARGAEMAQRLSELFRRIAGSAQHATMPLASELAIVREYLAIEEVRLGDRLGYAIDEPAWSNDRHVPTLMIQTLVENAIKHGIAPSIEGGRLRVSVFEREDGLYECIVFNTGAPLARSVTSREPLGRAVGTGLANTGERLRQLYGDDCTLSLEAVAGGTRASFWFTGEPLAQNLARRG